MDTKQTEKFTINSNLKSKINYIFKRYIQEILEAFIAYSLYRLITEKTLDIKKAISMSLFIGFITLILEEYNSAYKDTIKNGMIMTVSSQLIKNSM